MMHPKGTPTVIRDTPKNKKVKGISNGEDSAKIKELETKDKPEVGKPL